MIYDVILFNGSEMAFYMLIKVLRNYSVTRLIFKFFSVSKTAFHAKRSRTDLILIVVMLTFSFTLYFFIFWLRAIDYKLTTHQLLNTKPVKVEHNHPWT